MSFLTKRTGAVRARVASTIPAGIRNRIPNQYRVAAAITCPSNAALAFASVMFAAVLCSLLVTGQAHAAAAAAPNSGLGDRIGNEISGIVGGILFSVAAACVIPVFFKRSLGEAFMVLALAVICGALVFAPEQMKAMVQGITNTIAPGGTKG